MIGTINILQEISLISSLQSKSYDTHNIHEENDIVTKIAFLSWTLTLICPICVCCYGIDQEFTARYFPIFQHSWSTFISDFTTGMCIPALLLLLDTRKECFRKYLPKLICHSLLTCLVPKVATTVVLHTNRYDANALSMTWIFMLTGLTASYMLLMVAVFILDHERVIWRKHTIIVNIILLLVMSIAGGLDKLKNFSYRPLFQVIWIVSFGLGMFTVMIGATRWTVHRFRLTTTKINSQTLFERENNHCITAILFNILSIPMAMFVYGCYSIATRGHVDLNGLTLVSFNLSYALFVAVMVWMFLHRVIRAQAIVLKQVLKTHSHVLARPFDYEEDAQSDKNNMSNDLSDA